MAEEILMYSTMGELIQKYRKQANLKLTKLANLTGISKGVISKIENGETKRPELKTILPLAKNLGISIVEIIEYYIEVDKRPEVLREILMEAIQIPNLELASKVAFKFLQSPNESSYVLVERLYGIAGTLIDSEAEAKLMLYDVIITYSREHGIQQYLAKSLLQKYLIERGDMKRLEDTFRIGEEIIHYVKFLSHEEQIFFYFRMGLHAHNTKKYEQCIELCNAGLELEKKNTELKARAYLAMINSYSELGDYNSVENYLEEFEDFDYDFVEEATKLTRAITKARKKEYDLAVPMLQICLTEISIQSRIHVVNELIEIYLQMGEITLISDLLQTERDILSFDPKTPYKHRSFGRYYKNKARFQIKTDAFDEGMKSFIASMHCYGEVSAFQEIIECMSEILSTFSQCSKSIEIRYVEMLKEVYNEIIGKYRKL